MVLLLLSALFVLSAMGFARYMAYLVRIPAMGLHEWERRRHYGMYEWRTMSRCRRCTVWVRADEVHLLPPDCDSTKDFLLVRDVMES